MLPLYSPDPSRKFAQSERVWSSNGIWAFPRYGITMFLTAGKMVRAPKIPAMAITATSTSAAALTAAARAAGRMFARRVRMFWTNTGCVIKGLNRT
ncbi:Uncharacterised protein [Mycobacteroides abscessus]|nr:Uncharacterised protein [Mycobacteroides abscessus]